MTTTTDGLCPSCWRQLQRTDYELDQCGSCGCYLADQPDSGVASASLEQMIHVKAPLSHAVLGPLYQEDDEE
jgi:hypothetical protein